MMLDDLAPFYADFGTLVTGSGGGFLGLLDVADQMAFDQVAVGTHRLRYPSSVALSDGGTVTIGGASYKVASPPLRIGDGLESVVGLVRL